MRKFAVESSFTMKILHTSDWHLGHTLYNYDRREEQQQMLRQMVRIASEQQPDVFLICGDVYHTPQPSAAVQTMLVTAQQNAAMLFQPLRANTQRQNGLCHEHGRNLKFLSPVAKQGNRNLL